VSIYSIYFLTGYKETRWLLIFRITKLTIFYKLNNDIDQH